MKSAYPLGYMRNTFTLIVCFDHILKPIWFKSAHEIRFTFLFAKNHLNEPLLKTKLLR